MPLRDQPEFHTVDAPDEYSWQTSSAVRYVPVHLAGKKIGYLWAATDDDAADFLPFSNAGATGGNAGVRWVDRLRESKAEGSSPLEALRRWSSAPEDPVAGRVPPDAEEREVASLAALREIAGA